MSFCAWECWFVCEKLFAVEVEQTYFSTWWLMFIERVISRQYNEELIFYRTKTFEEQKFFVLFTSNFEQILKSSKAGNFWLIWKEINFTRNEYQHSIYNKMDFVPIFSLYAISCFSLEMEKSKYLQSMSCQWWILLYISGNPSHIQFDIAVRYSSQEIHNITAVYWVKCKKFTSAWSPHVKFKRIGHDCAPMNMIFYAFYITSAIHINFTSVTHTHVESSNGIMGSKLKSSQANVLLLLLPLLLTLPLFYIIQGGSNRSAFKR